MNCDICGNVIVGPAFTVRVEGAKMLVCSSCQHLGIPYQEERPVPTRPLARSTLRMPRAIHRRAPELPRGMEESEVADNYSDLVRSRRMKMGLSQAELAGRVKERLSVIQKIETGKIAPDSRLCRELEHELRIKLLVPRKATPALKMAAPAEFTLGDIIRVKEKQKPTDTN
ncbi:MAG: multiprotein bridging factor aMBF1 [Candidatus Bathyarchaeia archaeon]